MKLKLALASNYWISPLPPSWSFPFSWTAQGLGVYVTHKGVLWKLTPVGEKSRRPKLWTVAVSAIALHHHKVSLSDARAGSHQGNPASQSFRQAC